MLHNYSQTSLNPSNSSEFKFEITYSSNNSRARLGRLFTPHGVVETPAFIFCATKASIKGVSPIEMKTAGTQFILSNTYHLMLQPGSEVVEKLGGLHQFMGWEGPMLTDSGGFQIFSLGHGSVAAEIKGNRRGSTGKKSLDQEKSSGQKSLVKITEEGALFRSYLDGSLHLLTPERSIDIQRQLGADIILVLDECTPFHVDKTYTAQSMEMSHRWAVRSLLQFERYNNGRQSLYGIIQGGVYEDLRAHSADFINQQNFFGHAIGGSLGASKSQMEDIVHYTKSILNPNRPTHLLGIGGIRDIFSGVKAGIDTFDCVHPTRLARHGGALVRPPYLPEGKRGDHINLKNSIYRLDERPIEDDCSCSTCQRHSRAYIHHLLRAKELLAYSLISIHNVCFMNRLFEAIREALPNETLDDERSRWLLEDKENLLSAKEE